MSRRPACWRFGRAETEGSHRIALSELHRGRRMGRIPMMEVLMRPPGSVREIALARGRRLGSRACRRERSISRSPATTCIHRGQAPHRSLLWRAIAPRAGLRKDADVPVEACRLDRGRPRSPVGGAAPSSCTAGDSGVRGSRPVICERPQSTPKLPCLHPRINLVNSWSV